MANIKGIHHVALRASDYEKSLKMYTALGLTVRYEWGEGDGRICMLSTGGGMIEIFAGSGDRYPAEGRFQHLALEVEDVDAAYALALEAGFTVKELPREGALRTKPVPVPIRLGFVSGPDGETVEFFHVY